MAYRNYALFRKTSGKTKLVSLKQTLKNTVSKFKFFCFQGSYITSMVKIIPTPYDANVTLTSDGFSQFGNSIIVQKGREVSVKVEKDGYTPYETTIITGEQDYTLEISLDKNIQFDFVINTSLNSTDVNDTTYIVPFTPGTYTSLKNKPLVIGWGDGSETTITDGVITKENCSHTYEAAGMYTISITSDTQTMPEISFYDNYKDINNNALKFLGTNSSMLLMVDENGNSITSSDNLFKDCVNLNAVSRDLFKYNSQLVDLNSCFENCSKMKTLGYDFMYYVPNLITASNMFKNCDGISTIPYGFLKLNTELLDCSGMFNDCDNLVSTPNNLFFNNKKIVNYSECFRNCEKLTYNRYIFGEDYSHLGNVSNPNFSYMFYRESFTGTNTGFAPEIWDVVVTPLEYSQQCFGEYMCNETLENYWRIPEEWGGPDRISVTMNIDDDLSTVLYDYNLFELPYYQDEGWNRVQINPTPSNADVNIVHTLNGYPDEYKSNVIYSNTMGVVHNGVASGFSTSNYLNIPKKFPTNSTNFEIVFRFKSNDFSDWQYWFNTAPYYSLLLGTTLGGKIVLYVSNNTSSWDVVDGVQGVTTLDTNTWYYVKCTYNGQAYQVYISRDNINWTQELSVSSTKPVGVAYDGCWIGNGWTGQVGVKTTIDLTQSYIKNNNELWWDGKEYTAVGFWDNEGAVGTFNETNYLKLPKLFNPGSTPWEIVLKFKINAFNTTSTWINLFGNGDATDRTAGAHIFYNTSGQIRFEACTLGAASWDIVASVGTTIMTTNKFYWVKAEFTGSQYNVYLSSDGITYTKEISVSSTTAIGASVPQSLGSSVSHPTVYHNGLIDLSESYIKINGEMWWNNKTNEYKYWDEDYVKNYTTVGTQGIITSHTASGFTSNSYVNINKSIALGNNFEILIKLTTGEDILATQGCLSGITNQFIVFGALDGSSASPYTEYMGYNIGTGTAWLCPWENNHGKNKIKASTTYYIKMTYDGLTYIAYLSTDGLEWVEDWRLESTQTIPTFIPIIGNTRDLSGPYTGKVHLSESYIKINNETVWDGTTYTTVGSWDSEGKVSGFGASNYIQVPQTFNPGTSPWEIIIKFNPGSTISETKYPFGCTNSDNGILFGWVSGVVALWISSNGTSWDIASQTKTGSYTLVANTDYYAKILFDGKFYELWISTDGSHWRYGTKLASTTIIHPCVFFLGAAWDKSTAYLQTDGYVDLNETHININGTRWWDCQTKNKTNYVTNIKDKEFLTLPNNELRIDVSRDGYNDYFNHYTITDDTTITPSLTASSEI